MADRTLGTSIEVALLEVDEAAAGALLARTEDLAREVAGRTLVLRRDVAAGA